MSQKAFRHIIVDEENYRSLRKLGQTGESFNDVISVILNKRKKL